MEEEVGDLSDEDIDEIEEETEVLEPSIDKKRQNLNENKKKCEYDDHKT